MVKNIITSPPICYQHIEHNSRFKTKCLLLILPDIYPYSLTCILDAAIIFNNNLFRIYYTHNLNHHICKHLVLPLIFNLLITGQLGYIILKTHKRYLIHPQLVYVFGFKLTCDKTARRKMQHCPNDFQIFQCDVQPQCYSEFCKYYTSFCLQMT